MRSTSTSVRLAALGIVLAGMLGACGSDSKAITATPATTTADAGKTTATTTAAAGTAAASTADTSGGSTDSGSALTLAVNPWTGSAVNANIAKVILESKLGTPTTLLDIDENATWTGLDDGSIDAVLEVWPSGHAADYDTYITGKKSVVDMGKLGPTAKIGWYVPTFVVDAHPELKTWEGFKDPALAKLFATAESGDQGQFLMGDPSYVTYDEQIIANLGLPLKYVVAGSEAAEITAIQQAIADKKPLLLQFWQPHWLQSKVALTQIELPAVTDACKASAKAADGKYACDYPNDELFKAANAGLKAKNAKAFAFLSKMSLTTDQQNEISATIDGDGMTPADAAKKWIDAHADIVAGWLA